MYFVIIYSVSASIKNKQLLQVGWVSAHMPPQKKKKKSGILHLYKWQLIQSDTTTVLWSLLPLKVSSTSRLMRNGA